MIEMPKSIEKECAFLMQKLSNFFALQLAQHTKSTHALNVKICCKKPINLHYLIICRRKEKSVFGFVNWYFVLKIKPVEVELFVAMQISDYKSKISLGISTTGTKKNDEKLAAHLVCASKETL